MDDFPKKLRDKLSERAANNALRELTISQIPIDFSSNDYLGFAKDQTIFEGASRLLKERKYTLNGATGSRLLSGNNMLYENLESAIAKFHDCLAAVVFNSGYDANLGLLGSVPQRGDIILYDDLIHASIRDGLGMSNAKAYKFKHNDLADVYRLVKSNRSSATNGEVYIITESVFSMDGDSPDLTAFVDFCKKQNCRLIVDEAHAVGVLGNTGEGSLQELGLHQQVFARIVTFGKAMGSHGAAVLGGERLKQYLVNFARSFIYTTGMPPHSLATILLSYQELSHTTSLAVLKENITYFREQVALRGLKFIDSNSAIQCCVISGNDRVKDIAGQLQEKGFDVKPILSPTVKEGEERLRFCLHAYNTKTEIAEVLRLLTIFI
ncbi:8-amino-7-oxononanoate synthase [Sediminicola sp. YIK13]|uniref:aminotransferase class I/II-fold pyridoxal phosphate-dependent enzyme n=1 Tax=Sediminicola sp. YIK13 TaxID=1453352 RepID=UPI000722F395|nr:8-amino-7-oxononanoate synthase [Sediminicola sp. YIK13]ALM08684.1 8-amino-7-oxononanoate synthase [Sediminicola sp. YIK13]